MSKKTMSSEQVELFDKLIAHSVDIVTELVTETQEDYPALVRRIERYFNYCAQAIYSRASPNLNRLYDDFASYGLGHKMDLLQIIVMLSLYAVHNMEPGACDRGKLRAELHALIAPHRVLARELRPCDHDHPVIGPDDNVFVFELEEYVETAEGAARLSS